VNAHAAAQDENGRARGQPMRLVNHRHVEQNCRVVEVTIFTDFFSVLLSSIIRIPSSGRLFFPPPDWEPRRTLMRAKQLTRPEPPSYPFCP